MKTRMFGMLTAVIFLSSGSLLPAAILAQYDWSDGITTPEEQSYPVLDSSGNGQNGWTYFATADGGVLNTSHFNYSTAVIGTTPPNRWTHNPMLDNRDFVYWRFENVIRTGFWGGDTTLASGSKLGIGAETSWRMWLSGSAQMYIEIEDTGGNYMWPGGIPVDTASHAWEFYYDGNGGPGGVAQVGLRKDSDPWTIMNGTAPGTIKPTSAPLMIGSSWHSSGVWTRNWPGTIGRVTIADTIVPEPASLGLLVLGGGLLFHRKR